MAIIANTWRATCNGSAPGDEVWSNVFHLDVTGKTNLTQTDADLIATIFSSFYDTINAIWSDETTLDDVLVADVRTDPAPTYNGAGGSAAAGSDPTPLPPQCALVISWTTALHSKSGRGRTYIGGIGAGNLNGTGRCDAGSVAVVVGAAETLVGDLDTNGTPLAVASRLQGVSRQVTGGRIGNVFDTQRRRSQEFAETFVALSL